MPRPYVGNGQIVLTASFEMTIDIVVPVSVEGGGFISGAQSFGARQW